MDFLSNSPKQTHKNYKIQKNEPLVLKHSSHIRTPDILVQVMPEGDGVVKVKTGIVRVICAELLARQCHRNIIVITNSKS